MPVIYKNAWVTVEYYSQISNIAIVEVVTSTLEVKL